MAVPAGRSARRGVRRLAGPSTMAKIYGTLRTALNDAVDNRLIGFNPCRGVELPENDQAEIEPWEAHDIGRFLDEAAMDPLSAMYELIALHGLRRGEACGATWDGLDDEAGVLTIRQQITDTGGDLGVWAPKIKSGRRKVDLGPGALIHSPCIVLPRMRTASGSLPGGTTERCPTSTAGRSTCKG
ncbi:hypothetical protein [Frankia sp. Cas4]|uniref:site-specific integrase n=1 Tax=Frankia sp. Cas4 TaxID=3073927 RepID=UPI002AD367D0|nr:hypothetical protein [Frankia sp. Cas4]